MRLSFLEAAGCYFEPNFLRDSEREAWLAYATSQKGEPAPVYHPTRSDMPELDLDTRTADMVSIPPEWAFASRIEARAAEISRHLGVSIARLQPPSLVRYREGSFFKMHRDCIEAAAGIADTRRVGARVATVVVPLSVPDRDYEGGELVIQGGEHQGPFARFGLPFSLPAGSLLAFPSSRAHEVRLIRSGVRVCVVAFAE